MAVASTLHVVLGLIAFTILWVLSVFPSIPFLPIRRTPGSLLGGLLMVLFRVITTSQADSAVDLPILGLLFGTMVVPIYLERADLFKYLGKLLSWKSQGPKDLLIRISLITAISSALFTNDTSCIALTEFVLEISSANIGSAATPIGNPQNLVITISFMDFVLGILPVTIMGVLIYTLLLLGIYWKLLDGAKRDDDEETITSSSTITPEEAQEILNLHSFSPIFERNPDFISKLEAVNESTSMSLEAPLLDQNGEENAREEASNALVQQGAAGVDCKGLAWKTCVYLITFGILVGLLIALEMSWTTITAALALIVLDFTDAGPSLEKVVFLYCFVFIVSGDFS
ncbi:hypothetical protein Cgig2_000177 [Carnegiea gigantea]|uniref:Citrate transporter-like domain-containing protein n=1 Tax=Carnegiea gigantea TaxID=171969 RepID=A0A9Q1KLK5_9CARY|nr:hypothetical protein Cgig2_000177 [Carnegiea gigantea]